MDNTTLTIFKETLTNLQGIQIDYEGLTRKPVSQKQFMHRLSLMNIAGQMAERFGGDDESDNN